MTNSSMSKLTILLCLKGRNSFTKRWLDYMAHIRFEHNIVIADGDADGYVKDLIKDSKYKRLKINFFEFKQQTKFIDYYQMILSGIEKSNSQYVMFCDNDDFILPNGLRRIISFLDNNPSHISRGGYISGFKLDGGKHIDYSEDFNLCFYYDKLHRTEEPLADWFKFTEEVLFNFQCSFYNVHKTEVIRKIYEEVVDMNFSDLTVTERFYQLRLPTLGKVSYDKSSFHYLRQKGTSSSANINPSLEFIQSDLPSDIRKLAKKISFHADNGSTKLEDHIINTYSQYLGYYFGHTMMRFRFPKLYNAKIFLFNSYIGKAYKKLINKLNHRKLLLKIRQYSDSGAYDIYVNEIKAISNYIRR